jgi:FkbM family methyltransferase
MTKKFVGSNQLIFDFGMNNGDDTEYYLKKGYKVVAVEANPFLVEQAKSRFSNEINTGRLVIHNVAIWSGYDKKPFYVNRDNDHWSSLDLSWAGRDNSAYVEVSIACVPVAHLLALHGVPTYIKTDIEGADDLVIKQLEGCQYLPLFLSLEDCRFGYEYLATLHQSGYRYFKLLNQANVGHMVDQSVCHNFKLGSSGPFGNDLPGEWLTYDAMVERYALEVRDRDNNRHAPRTIWWDIHCRGVDANTADVI